jgi:hypothetical protein
MDDPTSGTNDEQTVSQPEASAHRVRLPDDFDDSEDDGRSKSSDIEITPKKETKSNVTSVSLVTRRSRTNGPP